MVGGPELEFCRMRAHRDFTLGGRGHHDFTLGGRGHCDFTLGGRGCGARHPSHPEATVAACAAYLGLESLLCFASLEKSRLC